MTGKGGMTRRQFIERKIRLFVIFNQKNKTFQDI